jgi:hypothetical protein
MSRVILVLLLIVPAVSAAPVPKEDDAVRMKRLYGIPFDPEKACKFEPKGTSLRLYLPNQPLLLSGWDKIFTAPRVWRSVKGDFTVTVRVSFTIRAKMPERHADADRSRASGGLVVWGDDKEFMTVTRDEREASGEAGEFFRAEACIAGAVSGYSEYAESPGSAYLRISREGADTSTAYSLDGKKWKRLGTYAVKWGDEVTVGVVAENSYKAPFEVVFDEYAMDVPVK